MVATLPSSRSAPASLKVSQRKRTNTGRASYASILQQKQTNRSAIPKLHLPLLKPTTERELKALNCSQPYRSSRNGAHAQQPKPNTASARIRTSSHQVKSKPEAQNKPKGKPQRKIVLQSHGDISKSDSKAMTDLSADINEALGMIDIDGDGQISSEEYALARELAEMKITVEDKDGDGKFSKLEMAHAKALAGRRLMARKFFRDNQKQIHLIDLKFLDCSEDEVIDRITSVPAPHFSRYLMLLRKKEAIIRISGSSQVNQLLHIPDSGRAATGRLVDLSHSKGADVSYHRPDVRVNLGLVSTRGHKQRQRLKTLRAVAVKEKEKTRRQQQRDTIRLKQTEGEHEHGASENGGLGKNGDSDSTLALGMRSTSTVSLSSALHVSHRSHRSILDQDQNTPGSKLTLSGRTDTDTEQRRQTERRKDILFSARRNRCTKFGHTKGDIKGYGNFSNFAGTVIKQYGTMNY